MSLVCGGGGSRIKKFKVIFIYNLTYLKVRPCLKELKTKQTKISSPMEVLRLVAHVY